MDKSVEQSGIISGQRDILRVLHFSGAIYTRDFVWSRRAGNYRFILHSQTGFGAYLQTPFISALR